MSAYCYIAQALNYILSSHTDWHIFGQHHHSLESNDCAYPFWMVPPDEREGRGKTHQPPTAIFFFFSNGRENPTCPMQGRSPTSSYLAAGISWLRSAGMAQTGQIFQTVTVRRAWTTVCGNEKVERRESLSREVGKHVRTSWWNPAQSSNVHSKHSICLAPREEVYDTEVHLPAHTNTCTQLLCGYLLWLSEHQTSCR